jgi:UDP-2,3-diacylglucosamine hydrolase
VTPRPRYFLSDLHLRAPDDARTRRVVDFLRARRGEADAVYLVGDVFDLWLGYRSVVFSAFFPVLRAIADLVDSGTRVVVFPGNHDPDPGRFLARELGVELREGSLVEEFAGRRVWIEHGDLDDPRSHRHRIANRLAHARPLRWLARAVHPDVAWRLARGYAGAFGHYGDEPLSPSLLDPFFPSRIRAGADVVIVGHFHRALAHRVEVDGRPRDLYVLGDWVRHHTFLRWDGEFALCRDHGPDRPPEPLGFGDHPPP